MSSPLKPIISSANKISKPLLASVRAVEERLATKLADAVIRTAVGEHPLLRRVGLGQAPLSDETLLEYLTTARAFRLLRPNLLFQLHVQCSTAGYLRSAQALKKATAAKTAGRPLKSASNATLLEIVKANVYTGDCDTALRGAELLKGRGLSEEQARQTSELTAFALLLSGNMNAALAEWDDRPVCRTDREVHRRFSEYCRDKSVAIVAPAATDVNLTEEIDRHDIVVRMNHFRANACDGCGTKTNIVYYNGEVIRTHWDRIARELLAHDFTVLRGADNVARAPGDRVLELPRYPILFRAGLMGIQRVFFDIVRHRPKSITLFNANFYTGAKAYADNYIGAAARQRLQGASLHRHDLAQNFLMIKRLHETGCVQAGPSVSTILSLSIDQYIDALYGLYGAPTPGEKGDSPHRRFAIFYTDRR